jgi:hypothetical protein
MKRIEAGVRFIRSGFWLLLLGFVMSFGMVLHYVAGAQYPTGHEFMQNVTLWWACPWTLSTTVVLGGALCMILIGAVLTILAKQTDQAAHGGATSLAFWLCALSLVAMFLTGYLGYFVVDKAWPSFYYTPVTPGKNLWLYMQLACMVLYAIGVFAAFAEIRRAMRAAA